MYTVTGIKFKKAGKIYYFDPGDLELEVGDNVIVETVRGQEFGEVVIPFKEVKEKEVVAPLKKVLRKATEEDLLQQQDNEKKELEAFDLCFNKITEHKLDMKLIDVEFTFDVGKIIFYFTADGRVDFRDLVKDLAGIFKTRIELRQIGVRDEAKMLGGLGSCGREVCCASFLGDFDPVSIRMAKEQNLSLNPSKISGLCGRLMCCLKFENDTYQEVKDLFPQSGEIIDTAFGKGKVLDVDVVQNTVKVELEKDGQHVIIKAEELLEGEEELIEDEDEKYVLKNIEGRDDDGQHQQGN